MDHSNSGLWDSSPKTTFYLGLFVGIAVSSLLALVLVFGMMMSGRSMAAGAVAQAPAAAQPTAQPTANPSAAQPVAGPVKPVTDKDHVLGKKDAKVTVVEYSDFQCPFCGQFEPSIAQMMKDYPNSVRVVYRHFPLSFHENAQKAAEASECAAKLGGNDAFWKMHDQLFANQATLGMDLYVRLAKGLGLNESAFTSCVNSGETASIVSADEASGNDAGVNGTPATFVNGKLVSGAVPYATLKAELVAAGATN